MKQPEAQIIPQSPSHSCNLPRKGDLSRFAIALVFFLRAACGFAQLPESDVWLFQLEKKDTVYHYKNPLNITNRQGYDNQPFFTPDDKQILYVSICEDGQADIYQYEIKSHQGRRFTNTPESEYSPNIAPDGINMSCVVVEKDSAQRIWLYDQQGRFKNILHEGTDSVGYYAWLNKDSILYYKLTNPHSLRALDLKTGKDVWISDHPGRAFKPLTDPHQFIYAVKDSASIEYRIYDPALRKSSHYAFASSLNEDFVWNRELGLIRSEKASLLRYNVKTNTWDTLFSFENLGIKKITRFMFDSKNKQLVIVSNL